MAHMEEPHTRFLTDPTGLFEWSILQLGTVTKDYSEGPKIIPLRKPPSLGLLDSSGWALCDS